MIMIRYITIIFTIYSGLKSSPTCHAFDVSPGGKRPMAASSSRMISSINPKTPVVQMNPKPLRAVAIKPLAKEGSWNAYLDDEETGLVYYFNTMTGERTWKPPSSTFPEIPVDKWVTDNVKALRESYLKEYKSKRNFFSAHHHLGSTIKNLFNHKSKSHHGFATSTAADTSSSHQHKTTQPKSFFAHATYASNPVIDVIPEPTTATTSHKETHDNPTGATPIDKLMEQNVIYQKDDNFVVAKEVFETINEKSSKMINDSLNDIRERIENTKTFVTGFMSGGVAVAPVVALQDIVMKFSLSSDAINEFYLDTAFCSFQCALFAMLLRFCIQNDEKDNDFLTNGIVASSALLRTMIMTSNDHFGWQMIQHLTVGGLESYAMFTAVAAAFDFGCKHGFLSRSK